MTIKQIEEDFVARKNRRPFEPFTVEMANGDSIEVAHAGLAINESGAGFIGKGGGIVDIEFADVKSIHAPVSEAVA